MAWRVSAVVYVSSLSLRGEWLPVIGDMSKRTQPSVPGIDRVPDTWFGVGMDVIREAQCEQDLRSKPQDGREFANG